MTDERRTPRPPGVRPQTQGRRARDTIDELQDIQRDLVLLEQRIGHRLDGFEQRLFDAKSVADEARAATLAKPIAWGKVISLVVPILVLAATVTVTMDRKVSRDMFDDRSLRVDSRLSEFERQLTVYKTSAEMLREVIDATRAAVLRRDEIIQKEKKK
jgi:hypothetical protein